MRGRGGKDVIGGSDMFVMADGTLRKLNRFLVAAFLKMRFGDTPISDPYRRFIRTD